MSAAVTAAAGAIAQAIKASGAIVRLEPAEFQKLLDKNVGGLVVHAPRSFFSRGEKYMMGYKGLAFYTSSPDRLRVHSTCELVEARKVWIPG